MSRWFVIASVLVILAQCGIATQLDAINRDMNKRMDTLACIVAYATDHDDRTAAQIKYLYSRIESKVDCP